MYPYNLKRKNTPIVAKERVSPQSKSDLSADRRLLELLQMAKKDAAALEKKYNALLQEETLKEAEDIIHTMETDGKKHQRILREILFTIFSDSFEDILEEVEENKAEQKPAEELLEELLFMELDDIPFYRSLLEAMDEEDLWSLLFEILTDKQNHTAALNHLYAKYMR